jgi:hypothetical protein
MTLRRACVLLAGPPFAAAIAFAQDTRFSNQGGVVNTRHNLTQAPIGGGAEDMNSSRNDYGEVCVQCHTPHGANTRIAAPLWNHTVRANTYTMAPAATRIGDDLQPGTASLTCLSCHDGTVAIDSIINMPGAGRYDPAQERAQNNTFLDNAWRNPRGADPVAHAALDRAGCLSCHAPGSGRAAQDFSRAVIGTDLRDDHPVGVPMPAERAGEFTRPPRRNGRVAFYDRNANDHAGSNEVRMYDNGRGFTVECASRHDPHGTPEGARRTRHVAKFLRVTTDGGALCLTCHVK